MAGLIEHAGVVETIADGRMQVAVDLGGCASCGHGSQCGMAALARRKQRTLIDLAAAPGIRVGQTVLLGLPEQGGRAAALLGYLLPALALVIGAALGQGGGDAGTALGALIGFLLALGFARVLGRRLPKPARLLSPQPVLAHSSSSHSTGVLS